MDTKVGIIGAGPAGVAAAVQLKRYGIEAVLFEKEEIGGLIRNAYCVENSMLFPEGIKGTDLTDILKNYVKKYDIEVIYEEVKKIDKKGPFRIETNGGLYESKYVILATGTVPKKLPFKELKYHVTELKGHTYESVAVIGGGDIALDYSLTLSEISKHVSVIHRSEIKAILALQKRVRKRKNIELMKGEIKNIKRLGSGFVVTIEGLEMQFDEILVAIGRVPFIPVVNIEDPRLFVIGDAKNGIYRQSSLAIADGIRTAMKIWRWERYGDP